MRKVLLGLVAIGLALAACEKKGEEAKPVGKLEFSVVPDTLKVSTKPGDYTVSVTGKETGGAAVTMDSVLVVVTYADRSHIEFPPGTDLTASEFTWGTKDPEKAHPAVAEMLKEFWSFGANETKTFELPVRIGMATKYPEDFSGLYLPAPGLPIITKQGLELLMVTLTYEATDENGNPVVGTIVLYIQVQT